MVIRQGPGGTRDVILNAASEEILKSGFHASSLSHIAARLGLTKGALAYHFPTKRVIFDALMTQLTESIAEASARADTAFPDSPSRACLAFIAEIGYIGSVNPVAAAGFIVVNDVSVDPEEIVESYQIWHGQLTQYMKRAVSEEGAELTMSAAQAGELLVAIASGIRLTARITHRLDHQEDTPFLYATMLGLGFANAAELFTDVYNAAERGQLRSAAVLGSRRAQTAHPDPHLKVPPRLV